MMKCLCIGELAAVSQRQTRNCVVAHANTYSNTVMACTPSLMITPVVRQQECKSLRWFPVNCFHSRVNMHNTASTVLKRFTSTIWYPSCAVLREHPQKGNQLVAFSDQYAKIPKDWVDILKVVFSSGRIFHTWLQNAHKEMQIEFFQGYEISLFQLISASVFVSTRVNGLMK